MRHTKGVTKRQRYGLGTLAKTDSAEGAYAAPMNTVIFGAGGLGTWPNYKFHTDRKLTNVDFVNCDFSAISFYTTEFTNVTFTDCDLAGASMSNCDLSEVTFTNCDLTKATFLAALLDFVTFSPSNMDHAALSGALLSARSPLPSGYKRIPVPHVHSLVNMGSLSPAGKFTAALPRDTGRTMARGRRHDPRVLVYDCLDYDLQGLDPRAWLLAREHLGISVGHLRALCSALDPAQDPAPTLS